jgi:hypothetical protein
VKVSWDDFPFPTEWKHTIHVPNHQPVIIFMEKTWGNWEIHRGKSWDDRWRMAIFMGRRVMIFYGRTIYEFDGIYDQ